MHEGFFPPLATQGQFTASPQQLRVGDKLRNGVERRIERDGVQLVQRRVALDAAKDGAGNHRR
jgi:hypothetical protein